MKNTLIDFELISFCSSTNFELALSELLPKYAYFAFLWISWFPQFSFRNFTSKNDSILPKFLSSTSDIMLFSHIWKSIAKFPSVEFKHFRFRLIIITDKSGAMPYQPMTWNESFGKHFFLEAIKIRTKLNFSAFAVILLSLCMYLIEAAKIDKRCSRNR